MKRLINGLLLAAFVLAAPASFAAPNTIMVLFNGNTEVNRHVYNFVGQVLGNQGYRITASLDPSAVKPGQYKAVIVVSTKTTSGIDPALASFLASYPAPKEVYLISLLSRTGSLSVTPFTASSNPYKVDGVTAATTWSRGSQQMHSDWMQELVTALAAK
jgi:hypothetical protein